MADVKNLIAELEQVALEPRASVAKLKADTGKKLIGMFPLYLPEEIVYAHGMLPVGMWGGQTEIRLADKYLQSFCCSVIRANLEFGMNGTYDILDGIVMATYCDTLKCVCEDWKYAVPQIPFIPMVYPQNRNIQAGIDYMEDEFARVEKELSKISGKSITEADLEAAWEVYENYRAACRRFVKVVERAPKTLNAKTRHLILKAAWFMDKKQYTNKLNEIVDAFEAAPAEEFNGKKVVVEGILVEPLALLDAFVENDILIVADDLAHQSRQFRTPGRAAGSVYEKMAHRIADTRGCALLYEERKTKGDFLIDLVKANKADGLVVCMMKFCDPEEYDYPIFKVELEKANIPMLYMEIEQKMETVEPLRTRIQSFAEMLS